MRLLPHLKRVAGSKAALTKTLALNAHRRDRSRRRAGSRAHPPRRRRRRAPHLEFKPSRDAFAFPNAFPGLPVKSTFLDRARPGLRPLRRHVLRLRRFFTAPPTDARHRHRPAKGSALWTYLFKRQADTLESGIAEKFILWTNL